MDLFFRGSHTTNFVTCGFNRSYNQAAEVPSSNVTCTSPRSPSINCRIMLAFVSITHSITIFPAPFITAIEMLSLCTSIPIYFLLSIEGVPFCRGCGKHPNPTPKGAPFYIALRYRTSNAEKHLFVCKLPRELWASEKLGDNSQECLRIRVADP